MDAPCVAPSRITKKIFAVLVEWYHRIVLTMSFKLVSFLHLWPIKTTEINEIKTHNWRTIGSHRGRPVRWWVQVCSLLWPAHHTASTKRKSGAPRSSASAAETWSKDKSTGSVIRHPGLTMSSHLETLRFSPCHRSLSVEHPRWLLPVNHQTWRHPCTRA